MQLRKGQSPPQAQLAAKPGQAKDGTWDMMYTSANGHLDGLFEYLGNLPALDISAWTTCLHSGEPEKLGSPRMRRRA